MISGALAGNGSFSHINEHLLDAIRSEMGPTNWIDVQGAHTAPRVIARSIPSELRRDPSLALNPRRLYHSRIHSVAAFDAMSRAAQRAGEACDAAYVLQTQSLFNARRAGRPFFIYTDYTELANRHVDRPHRLAGNAWLGRERRLYSEADRIFAASRAAHDSLMSDYGVRSERLCLVQTGLNVPVPDEVPERTEGVFEVLFVGIDWERKGGPDLLAAFTVLRQAIPTAHLRIVGPRPELQAPPGVTFLGRIPPSQVSEELRRATVFCLPALHEPAGIAYSEASAWGLPVVATTAGNIPDRVIHDETGLLVAPGDRQAIADALIALARDGDRRRRMGEAGRAYTLSRFTWGKIAAAMAEEIRPFLTA